MSRLSGCHSMVGLACTVLIKRKDKKKEMTKPASGLEQLDFMAETPPCLVFVDAQTWEKLTSVLFSKKIRAEDFVISSIFTILLSLSQSRKIGNILQLQRLAMRRSCRRAGCHIADTVWSELWYSASLH